MDNEALARWLAREFVAHFGAWRRLPRLGGMRFLPLDSVETEGDAIASNSETVRAGALSARLDWKGLGAPFCFVLPPERSATGVHHMPSVFLGCAEAGVTVNGLRRAGVPVPREIVGHRITTAMLAFSETWIRA
jgi:hypothetical protein